MATGKATGRIHITAVGSTASRAVARFDPPGVKPMLQLAREGVAGRYEVTASAGMITARQDELKGGRFDDAARAREITRLLADDEVAALVTIRGGGWFTRILDRIDFDALRRRRRTLHLFGFSEMTTLIAIAGGYPQAVGLYDLGPGFLYSGMERHIAKRGDRLRRKIDLPPDQRAGFAAGWALARYPEAFSAFFRDVADILDGVGSSRELTGRLLAGSLPASKRITITGGNLSVMLPLAGSKYARAVETRGKWLALEDLDESASSIDRMLATLKLNGLLDRAEGIILGDFHDGDEVLSGAVFHMLKHYLPARPRVPIIAIEQFGHIYPLSPLPLHREVTLKCRRAGRGKPRVTIEVPWSKWARE